MTSSVDAAADRALYDFRFSAAPALNPVRRYIIAKFSGMAGGGLVYIGVSVVGRINEVNQHWARLVYDG